MKRRKISSKSQKSCLEGESQLVTAVNMAEGHRCTARGGAGVMTTSPASSSRCGACFVSPTDHLSEMSLEILCHIIDYLPLYDTMRIESLSRKLHEAVSMHLRLVSRVNLTEGQIYGTMSPRFNDRTFLSFLRRCSDVRLVWGLHPLVLARRRQRGSETLSVPGVITALQHCPRLRGVETSDIFLLEALLSYLPHIELLQTFKNRNGCFPPPAENKLTLMTNAHITTLNLTGVTMPELPKMEYLQHLFLRWVQITDPHPFRDFGAPNLKTFAMNNCAGPVNALKYVPLVTGLATSHSLSRLELVRVPFLAGLIQHVVEESWPMQGFQQLKRIIVGACKHVLEVDIGYLMITCKQKLEDLSLQPSLSKDSFFVSLTLAEVEFPNFETLHVGFVDEFPEFGRWTSEELLRHGLAEVSESPASISDVGMKAASQVLPGLKTLVLYNCPHLHSPTSWFPSGLDVWSSLRVLRLWRCHAIRLYDFCEMVPLLPALESLQLEYMFREPPKGCSRVGLSAGTGLGVSAALVSNNGTTPNIDNNNAPAPAAAAPPPPPPGAPPVEDDEPQQGEGNGVGLQAPPSDDVPAAASSRNAGNNTTDVKSSPDSTPAGNVPGSSTPGGATACVAKLRDKSSTSSGCDTTTKHNQSKPETSTAKCVASESGAKNHSSQDVPTSSQSGSEQPKPVSSGRTDIDRYASACHGGPLQHNSTAAARGRGSSTDGRQSALQIQLADNRSERQTSKDAPQFHLVDPSGTEAPCGKGKSLIGSRKGVVKRSHPSRLVHQSCQAVSEEIRQSTKKAKEGEDVSDANPIGQSDSIAGSSESPRLTSKRQHSPPVDTAHGEMFSRRAGGKRPKMCDQATSTSDPVIEDDHIQVFTLRSSTLVNVNLFHVGITDLVIEQTPALQILTGCACRVLKNVLIRKAPRLARVSFSQCRKLRHEDLVDEVCTQPADVNRLIILRPVQNYEAMRLEKLVFSTREFKCHMCLVHDHSTDPTQILQGQHEAADWLDIDSGITNELLKTGWESSEEATRETSTVYPWGRDVFRRYWHGEKPPCKLVREAVSDMPWWRHLVASEKISTALEQEEMHAGTKRGPGERHWLYRKICTDILPQEIAEARETGLTLYQHSTVVYVNLCDSNGTLTPDMYL